MHKLLVVTDLNHLYFNKNEIYNTENLKKKFEVRFILTANKSIILVDPLTYCTLKLSRLTTKSIPYGT